MYDTQHLILHFSKELPIELRSWLLDMKNDVDEPRTFDKLLFKTKRWELLGRQADSDLSDLRFEMEDNWLQVDTIMKNYEDEYGKFIELLLPYTDFYIDIRTTESTNSVFSSPIGDNVFYKLNTYGNVKRISEVELGYFFVGTPVEEIVHYYTTDRRKLQTFDNLIMNHVV